MSFYIKPLIKILLKGTLEEKLEEDRKINSTIKKIRKKGIRESTKLDELLARRYELENDINLHLYKEKIKNPVLDYCFSHFVKSKASNEKKYPESVFEKTKVIKEFLNNVKEMKNERILCIQGGYIQTGIISDNPVFEIKERRFRNLYVPVDDFKEFNSEDKNWKNKSSEIIYINGDIFDKVSMFFDNKDLKKAMTKSLNLAGLRCIKGYHWEADYSREIYFGKKPKNIDIYLGNEMSKNNFGFHSTCKITQREKTIKIPNPF